MRSNRNIGAALVVAAVAALSGCEDLEEGATEPVPVVKTVGGVRSDETALVVCWVPDRRETEVTHTWNVLAAVAPAVGEPWLCGE